MAGCSATSNLDKLKQNSGKLFLIKMKIFGILCFSFALVLVQSTLVEVKCPKNFFLYCVSQKEPSCIICDRIFNSKTKSAVSLAICVRTSDNFGKENKLELVYRTDGNSPGLCAFKFDALKLAQKNSFEGIHLTECAEQIHYQDFLEEGFLVCPKDSTLSSVYRHTSLPSVCVDCEWSKSKVSSAVFSNTRFCIDYSASHEGCHGSSTSRCNDFQCSDNKLRTLNCGIAVELDSWQTIHLTDSSAETSLIPCPDLSGHENQKVCKTIFLTMCYSY